MSKLYSRAKVRLHSAENNWKMRKEDDAYIDVACFDLQQSIEFSLKALVELHGESYAQNHDLRAQLNKLAKLNVNYDVFQKIAQNASTFNSWETESRYKDSFIALEKDVQLAIQISRELLAIVEKELNNTKIQSMNLFKD